MKKVQYLLFTVSTLLLSLACLAQETGADEVPQMADGLRSSGKIYVVVAVVLTILAGVVIYLIQLDKKIRRLEKEANAASPRSRVESRESDIARH